MYNTKHFTASEIQKETKIHAAREVKKLIFNAFKLQCGSLEELPF